MTNDFPPAVGGIETFTLSLVSRLPATEVVVLTRRLPGASAIDATLPFPVIRVPMSPLLPGRRLGAWVVKAVQKTGASAVWFPSAMPLGLLAPTVRRAGVGTIVASTHGHEVWWARVPAARTALRTVADSVDHLTFVTEFTRRAITPAVSHRSRGHVSRLSPGVDPNVYRPDPEARARIRSVLGLHPDRPVVLALSRLVTRKGHDTLLRAWPAIRRRHGDAVLVIVGDGPRRRHIKALADSLDLGDSVRLVGGVAWHETPAWYAAADVFALPTRTRLAGLEPEALGICYLEAAAAGLPVVAGRSGGVAEAVEDGVSGALVDGGSVAEVASAVIALLDSPALAAHRGAAGRARVVAAWSWDVSARHLQALVSGAPASTPVVEPGQG